MKRQNQNEKNKNGFKIDNSDQSLGDSDPDENSDTSNNSANDGKNSQNLKKDLNSISLLMFLYFLQGIPIGLTGSLPFILSSRKISYADQGTFSFALWPFSLKLLWAPIVDSIFWKRFGRRKSWLIPVQYLIGLFMILFADYTQLLLEGKSSSETSHSAIFFMFTFLAATQDIAVDGWALTMLSKDNVAWGSTCNSVGQTAGWFVGNVIFLTVESADFSNKYLRPLFNLPSQTHGLVTIDKFMMFFGFVFIISTTFVMLLKKETEPVEEESSKKEHSIEQDLTVSQTYKLMWQIIWLGPVKLFILILLTVKVGFASESMSFLKMIENGVSKEKLGLLAIPLTPLQIVLPLVISRYTNGPKPLNLYVKAIPFRLAFNLVVVGWVFITPIFREAGSAEYPLKFYILCLIINIIHSIFTYSMFVSQMAFFSRICDKRIGGTYMTLLNTITNMGGNWPNTAALYIAGMITFKSCNVDTEKFDRNSLNSTVLDMIQDNKCLTDTLSKSCETLGGKCITDIDPFYVIAAATTVIGIVWIIYFRSTLYKIQSLPKQAWKVSQISIK